MEVILGIQDIHQDKISLEKYPVHATFPKCFHIQNITGDLNLATGCHSKFKYSK